MLNMSVLFATGVLAAYLFSVLITIIGGEAFFGGFSWRVVYNFFGDRISDVGANEAPDIVEQGRGTLDVVLAQKIRGLTVRATLENLTDSDFLWTQTLLVPRSG